MAYPTENRPLYRCFVCDHENQLTFDPRKDGKELEEFRCEKCGEFAFWGHHVTLVDIKKRYFGKCISL